MSVLDRFSLRGKIALVTGGAGPLFGSSIAAGLLEAGATLVTASRSLERNLKFAAEWRSKGFDAKGMEVDLAQPDSIERLHEEVIKTYGRLDILVNSAVSPGAGSFESQSAANWLDSARADMAGLFWICRLFVGDMVRQGRGSIVNISSIYGMVGNDPTLYEYTDMVQAPSYNFVKAGMINFTRYMANYYGKQGVRANCICPGGYFNNQAEPFVKNYCHRVPVGRMMTATDIQGAVVFLASDASEYITGANLPVDGGWTAL